MKGFFTIPIRGTSTPLTRAGISGIGLEALVPKKRQIKTSKATQAAGIEVCGTVRERLACLLSLSRREARGNICIFGLLKAEDDDENFTIQKGIRRRGMKCMMYRVSGVVVQFCSELYRPIQLYA